jgi:CBS domain-containing protein
MRAGVSVAEVMRHQVVAVREGARLAEIIAAMSRYRISSVPVIDKGDRVIGLISHHDLLAAEERYGPGGVRRDLLGGLLRRLLGRKECPDVMGRLAAEVMSAPAVTVTAGAPACEAAREMYRRGIHQLPVVDPATGRLTGIVTRADLLAVYERPDEDIRGEILHDIIERRLGMAPERFEVTCVGGTVTIRGRLGHRSSALRLAEAIAHVGGVVAVRDHLAYELDDTATEPPSARL